MNALKFADDLVILAGDTEQMQVSSATVEGFLQLAWHGASPSHARGVRHSAQPRGAHPEVEPHPPNATATHHQLAARPASSNQTSHSHTWVYA